MVTVLGLNLFSLYVDVHWCRGVPLLNTSDATNANFTPTDATGAMPQHDTKQNRQPLLNLAVRTYSGLFDELLEAREVFGIFAIMRIPD